MEFWGVEVKPGAPLQVQVGDDWAIHITKATLGEVKNDEGNTLIPLFLNVNGQKIVIGSLSPEKIHQISYDLVLDNDFELSHNWKNGSIYFFGNRNFMPDSDGTGSESDSDFGNELPVVVAMGNGEPEPRDQKPYLTSKKANDANKVKIAESSKNDNSKEDEDNDSDDDSDEDDDSEDSGSEGGPMDVSGEDSSEDDQSGEDDETSDEEDEETPKKAEQEKKRQADSATKTPVPGKKAKIVTPEKTGDSKKGSVHVATPYPFKKAGKTPTNDKSKQQTPKSDGQVVCKSCSKSFNLESALQSHTKAKHSGGK